MSKRASYAQVQIAASGEPTMIEKICTIHQYRQSPATSSRVRYGRRPITLACRRTRNRAFTGKKISTAYMDQAAIQQVPTPPQALGHRPRCRCGVGGCAHVRARASLEPYGARAPSVSSVRGHLRALPVSDAYPPHQVVELRGADSRIPLRRWAKRSA